jgi:hypothetical protein
MGLLKSLFATRHEVPASVRSAVPGKVLAAVEAQDGTWLAGTRDALHVVRPAGSSPASLRWEEVQRADWDLETATLRVERVEEYGRPLTPYSFVLTEPGALLPLIRERVTASVLLQRRVDLERRRGFTVIGRRSPTGRGVVTWAFEFDRGVDPDDPQVREAAGAALREAQQSVGLPS